MDGPLRLERVHRQLGQPEHSPASLRLDLGDVAEPVELRRYPEGVDVQSPRLPSGGRGSRPGVARCRIANPALGDFLYKDGLRSVLPPVTRESSFRRLRLGQWVEDLPEAWLPSGSWDSCANPGEIPDGTDVVLGFDGSFSGDCTALVAVSVADPPRVAVVELWEPDGAQVPIADVEDAIRRACLRWRVREIVADPFRWARSLQVLAGEGLPVERFPQSPERMTPATARFYEAVVNGQIQHDGDRRLAAHVAHAVACTDSRGTRMAKDSKHSTRRIDLAVAAVMAHARGAELAHVPAVQVF